MTHDAPPLPRSAQVHPATQTHLATATPDAPQTEVGEQVFTAARPESDTPRGDLAPLARREAVTWAAHTLRDASGTQTQITAPPSGGAQDIKVTNKDLGDVTIRIYTDADSVKCHFVCADAGADVTLRGNLDSLIDDLHRLGYRDVKTSFGSLESNTQGGAEGRRDAPTNAPSQDPSRDDSQDQPQGGAHQPTPNGAQTPTPLLVNDSMDLRI
ncbi:MAG: hypothetical protein ACPGVS_10555 [Primorskyibacter sp.]